MTFFTYYLILMSISAVLTGTASAVNKRAIVDRETMTFDMLFIFGLPFIGIGISLVVLSKVFVKRCVDRAQAKRQPPAEG